MESIQPALDWLAKLSTSDIIGIIGIFASIFGGIYWGGSKLKGGKKVTRTVVTKTIKKKD